MKSRSDHGRRRDKILRIIADDPRIAGLKPGTVMLGLASFFFWFGVLLLAAWAGIVRNTALGLLVCLGLSAGMLALGRYTEHLQDDSFILWLFVFYIRRYVTHRNTIFAGAVRAPRREHFLDDVVLMPRLARQGGLEWRFEE
jgi:hypothetical protein